MFRIYTFFKCVFAFVLLTQLYSCQYAKHISKKESILWQNRVLYQNTKIDKTLKEEISSQVNAAIIQNKLNTVIFGLDLETLNIGYHMPRRRLLNYNLLYKTIQKDTVNNFYLKKHIAEKPVVFNTASVATSINNIKTTLYNQGYFYAKVKDSVVHNKKQKTAVYYLIDANKNFTINGVDYRTNNPDIKSILETNRSESITKYGQPLTLSNISKERTRIAQLLISKGYYYLRPDAIEPEIDIPKPNANSDSTNIADSLGWQNNTTTNIVYKIKDSSYGNKIEKYYLKDVIMYIDENVQALIASKDYKEVEYLGTKFRYKKKIISEEILFKNIFMSPGSYFNLNDLEATLNRLNKIQVFSTVNQQTIPSASGKPNELDCIIALNVDKKYSDRLELESSTGSQNYEIGSNLKYSITNNNVFKGADLLAIGLHAGLQANTDDNKFSLFQYTYGASTELSFPKFLFVQNFTKVNKLYIPITKIGLSYDISARPTTFTQSSINGSFTYKWQKSKRINYKLTPLFLNFVNTSKIDQTFFANATPYFRSQLNNISIIGSSASLEYTNKLPTFQHNYTNFSFGIEKAGTIVQNVVRTLHLNDSNFVKYTRLQTQLRHYINAPKSSLASRIMANVGIPGKNNASLPLVKQFAAGGASSMRGWRLYQLGPGSSFDSLLSSEFLNYGDIQLELNTEYRFKMFRLFSTIDFDGAIFADAGNIWQYRNNNSNSQAQFRWHKLGKDLALNTGAGVRLDFSLFVLRLDLGIQLRKPYEIPEDRWLKTLDIRSKAWRQENAALQIGFSYPF